jgi:hypothetical protein
VNPEKTCLIRVFDDYFATEEAQPAAPQQTATDMGGSTPHHPSEMSRNTYLHMRDSPKIG